MSHTVLRSSSLPSSELTTCRVVPFNKNELEPIVSVATPFRAPERVLAVPTCGLVHVIKEHDLMFLEACGNYTNLWLKNGKKITTSRSMKHIEKTLSTNNFLRIHQSFIVNKIHVHFVQKDALELSNGRRLNIARSRRKAVQAWIALIRIF